MRSHRARLVGIASSWWFGAAAPLAFVLAASPALATDATTRPAARPAPPRNIFGVHLLVDDLDRGESQLQWSRYLVGRWGHVKTMFADITAETTGPKKSWVRFVERCYELELVPLIRLAGVYDGKTLNGWIKPEADAPGDYTSMARAVRRVVEGLPRSDRCPLYIEVWNEPNLDVEWSGKPNAKEYADFFVQVAAALHAIGDPRIVVLNGGLATGPDFTEEMCKANPEFIRSFDVWASHPYPQNRPPQFNHRDGTAPPDNHGTIDSYVLETAVLARFGRPDVEVMITETGYDLGNGVYQESQGYPVVNEVNRADYMLRAFRDYWPRDKKLVAVFPFLFVAPGWERFDWVYPDSGTNPDGSPTKPHPQYTAVAALAKSTDPTGAISGRCVIDRLMLPVCGVRVTCEPGLLHTTTDEAGTFFFPRLRGGDYRLRFEANGYRPHDAAARVRTAANTVADTKLDAAGTGTLRGQVIDGIAGRPLDNVTLTCSPPVEARVVTQRDGTFGPVPLLPVAYRLTLERSGYETVSVPDVQVPVGKTDRLRIPLAPRQSPDWPNLLGNPSFEDGTGGGGQKGVALRFEPTLMGPCEVSRRFATSGFCSQMLHAAGAPTTIRQITHYSTARVGKKYVGGAWVRTVKLTGGATISVDFTDNGGLVVGSTGPSRALTGTSKEWTYLRVEGFAPERSLRVSFNLHVEPGDGDAWYDDAYLGVEP